MMVFFFFFQSYPICAWSWVLTFETKTMRGLTINLGRNHHPPSEEKDITCRVNSLHFHFQLSFLFHFVDVIKSKSLYKANVNKNNESINNVHANRTMRFNTPIVTPRGTTFYNQTKTTSPSSYFFGAAATSSGQPSPIDATKSTKKNVSTPLNLKPSSNNDIGIDMKKETKIDEQHEIVLHQYPVPRIDGLPINATTFSGSSNVEENNNNNSNNNENSAVVIIPNFDLKNNGNGKAKNDDGGVVGIVNGVSKDDVGHRDVGKFIGVVEVVENQGLMLVPSDLTADDDDDDDNEDEDSFVEGNLLSDPSTGDVVIGLLHVVNEEKKEQQTVANTGSKIGDGIINGSNKGDNNKVNNVNDGYFHPKMPKRTFLQEQQSKVHVPRPVLMNVGSAGGGGGRVVGSLSSKPSIRRSAVSVSERAKLVQSMEDEAKRRANDPYNLSQFKKSWRRPHPSHKLPSTAWKRTIKGMGPPPPKKTLDELP
mmetsp:Transcript_41180/g.98625  ORF Transcript_41180/g.98625 Transcript_41180/m.98625 type:complete len:480 (-) Transcript_41180:253-1692(-)